MASHRYRCHNGWTVYVIMNVETPQIFQRLASSWYVLFWNHLMSLVGSYIYIWDRYTCGFVFQSNSTINWFFYCVGWRKSEQIVENDVQTLALLKHFEQVATNQSNELNASKNTHNMNPKLNSFLISWGEKWVYRPRDMLDVNTDTWTLKTH